MNWLKIVGGYKFYDYLNFNWRESFLYLMIFWSLLFRANKKMLKLRFYGIYLASPTEKFQKNTTNKLKSLNEFALKAGLKKQCNKIRTMTWTENTFFTEEPLQSKMLLSCFDKRTFEVETVFWPKAKGLIWSSLILSDLVWCYANRAKQIKQNKLSSTQFINLH